MGDNSIKWVMVFKARMRNSKVTMNHFFWKTGLKRQGRTHRMEREERTKGPRW